MRNEQYVTRHSEGAKQHSSTSHTWIWSFSHKCEIKLKLRVTTGDRFDRREIIQLVGISNEGSQRTAFERHKSQIGDAVEVFLEIIPCFVEGYLYQRFINITSTQ